MASSCPGTRSAPAGRASTSWGPGPWADGGHLLLTPAQGGEAKEVGQTLFYPDFLSWSPDGRLRAFVDPGGRDTWGYFSQGQPRGKQIKVAKAATGQVRDITAAPSRTHLYPSFSPDGGRIAYVSAPVTDYDPKEYARAQGAGARRIWVMNADGSGKRQLTDDPGYADERPRWSKDGLSLLFVRRLAVEREEPLKAELWLMGADGSGKRRLAEGPDGSTQGPESKSGWFGYYGHINWDDLFAWHQGDSPVSR